MTGSERKCAREGCDQIVSGRADKKFHSKACKVRASLRRNYKKVRPGRTARTMRPLNARERRVLAACCRVLNQAAHIINKQLDGSAIEMTHIEDVGIRRRVRNTRRIAA